MNEHPLLDIKQVSYTYPDQKNGVALCEISLQVQRGEYLAIVGHNGSGKSTLAYHCNALLLPDSGCVMVEGVDTRDQKQRRHVRDIVGIIFQNPDNQIIATIVEDDVAWGLAVRGLPPDLICERVAYALDGVGISHLRRLSPHQLSGGQKQRLAIAGVLALRPQCIIADEATAMLDPLSRQELLSLLRHIHDEYGITIIHVTHLLDEVVSVPRVVVMEQGRVVADDAPARVFANVERLKALKLVLPEPIELVARLRAAGIAVSQQAVTLEAIAQELAR